MPVSIYAATVPAFLQILECQTSLIHKAASHADAKYYLRDLKEDQFYEAESKTFLLKAAGADEVKATAE